LQYSNYITCLHIKIPFLLFAGKRFNHIKPKPNSWGLRISNIEKYKTVWDRERSLTLREVGWAQEWVKLIV